MAKWSHLWTAPLSRAERAAALERARSTPALPGVAQAKAARRSAARRARKGR